MKVQFFSYFLHLYIYTYIYMYAKFMSSRKNVRIFLYCPLKLSKKFHRAWDVQCRLNGHLGCNVKINQNRLFRLQIRCASVIAFTLKVRNNSNNFFLSFQCYFTSFQLFKRVKTNHTASFSSTVDGLQFGCSSKLGKQLLQQIEIR